MTQNYGGPPTMRCNLCGTNWPFFKLFAECPDCRHDCRPVKLPHEYDEVLTWAEALERLRAADDEDSTPAPRKGRQPTNEELRQFRARLDFWGHAESPDDPRLRR